MRFLSLRPCVTTALVASALIFSGCENDKKPAGKPGSGGIHATSRVPNGAGSKHEAAVKLFNAYKTHNRTAGKEVASDAALNDLGFNAPGFNNVFANNPTLQLIDDSHIYYEGGSYEFTFARNANGRWYVRSATGTAD